MQLPHAIRFNLAQAQLLLRCNRYADATARLAALFEERAAPETLREMAARMCLAAGKGALAGIAPAAVYRHLLELPELSADDRIRVRQCLAERLLQENQPAAAREQLQAVLNSNELFGRERWNTDLQIAHTYLATQDYEEAREAYGNIEGDDHVPSEFRANAALCSADTFARERAYDDAIRAYASIADRGHLPPHLRQEAQERMVEVRRLQQGLPARDPSASRTRLPRWPEPGLILSVAVDGNDSQDGSRRRPLATLAGARDKIRALKAQRGLPEGGVRVLIGGGRYRIEETWELQQVDSGTAAAPIVYQNVPGQTPVYSGGVTIDEFLPVKDAAVLDRLPEAVRGSVLRIDLTAAGVTDFGSVGVRGYGRSSYPTHPWVDLYVDGQTMRLARWPNEGTIEVGEVTRGAFRTEESGRPGQFRFDTDRPQAWNEIDDIWMFGSWGHLWEGRCVRVAQLDAAAGWLETEQPSSYGFRRGQPFYFFNVLEELDRPGEWYLDRRAGQAYLLPPVDQPPHGAQFSALSGPVVKMQDVSHVSLRGLSFEAGRAEGAVISGGQDNLLAGCTFRRLGTNGVVIQGGRHHGVLGCDISALGAGGIRLSGGGRGSLTPGEHFVENCHIHDFSRVDRVYAPAVHVDGVGHRIAHNLFHDSPHHAMRVEGYDHAIEYNEVHSVVYEFDDQAGIDMYGNPAYRGNVIRYNFWHHIGSGHDVAGQAGIRLDDFISGVLVYGNVFYRCAGGRFGGVQIHGGKDNIVDNNLFFDCKQAISFTPWGEARWLERLDDERTQRAVRSGGVDISRPPHSTRWPDLASMSENPDRNCIWRNLAVDCGPLTMRDRGVNELMDNHAWVGDPGFVDPEARDFRLEVHAEVYDRFGFRPIPFGEIGLYEDEHRATWPVHHEITPHYVAE